MPSPTTIDEFLDLVRKSGVVDDKRLTAHVERLRAAGQVPADPVRFATQLVQDGVLTHFQAEQFLQGKWRRFTIGKYKVLERLGSGGMGSVYLCEHMLMRRRVAVKVLPASKAEDTASLERFYREARAVAALDHPNIVRAYDIDQDDKLHFLVMEHVDGSSLQEIVKRSGPMDVLRAAHYVRQAALGLQHAHETAGLVHRDIKPGNILVDRNGIVKVLDMGLARFFHDEADDLTRKHDENVLGTADYLAPEQALDSHGVDIRADIYSLGATFYFCLTGRTPFAEGTVAQKLIWHQTRQPKPVRTFRPEVPEGIAGIIDRMMSKAAEQRYPTPLAVADALIPWTQTPIPPPPENEMPQFSLAAKGSGEASMPPTTRTADLSPAPRKVWQVGSNPSVSLPATHPSAPSGAGQPSPAGSTATGAGATAPILRETRPPAPASPAPVARAPASPANRPATVNGPAPANGSTRSPGAPAVVSKPAPASNRAPGKVAPVERSPAEEDSSSWEDLDEKGGARAEDTPRRQRTGRAPAKKAPGEPLKDSKVLWWVIGGAAVAVCSLLLLIACVAILLSGSSKNKRTVRDPILVGPGHKSLARAVAGALPGDRIVLTGDINEAGINLNEKYKGLTIEAEEGKTVIWRFPPVLVKGKAPDPGMRLLVVGNVDGLTLKNITLSGEGRANALISLWGKCPGTRFESLRLERYKKYGVYITNCEGDPENKVLFSSVSFDSPKDAWGMFFDIQNNLAGAVPKNRFFAFDNCLFTGAGRKIKFLRGTKLDEGFEWGNLSPLLPEAGDR